MTALQRGSGSPDDIDSITKFAFAYMFGFEPDVVERMEATEVDKWMIFLEEIGREKGSNVPTSLSGFAEKRMFR